MGSARGGHVLPVSCAVPQYLKPTCNQKRCFEWPDDGWSEQFLGVWAGPLCSGDIPVKGGGAEDGLSKNPVVQRCWLLGKKPLQEKVSYCVMLQQLGCHSSGSSLRKGEAPLGFAHPVRQRPCAQGLGARAVPALWGGNDAELRRGLL